MKKLLLSFAMALVAASTQAQLSISWQKPADGTAYSWFTSGTNNATGCAYNPATDKLYVSNRNDRIAIINPIDGSTSSNLSTTGVGAESFKYNKIRVTSDGVIYAISLQTGASGGTVKIYRWADEASNPTEAASFTSTERAGDTFSISGTGTSTVLYVSGNASNKIYVLTTADGTTFTNTSTIAITANYAGRSISAINTGTTSDLWIDGPSSAVRRISSSGTSNYVIPNTNIPDLFSMSEYFAVGNQKYLAVVAANNASIGNQFRLYNITNEAAALEADRVRLYGSVSLAGTYATNANASGDIAIKKNGDDSYTFFSLITNNGLMAITNTQTLPVTLTSFDAALVKGQSTLTWGTAAETNNKGFEIYRSADAIDFKQIDFVAAKSPNGNSATAINYTYVDRGAKAGINYYKLKQVDLDGKSENVEKIVKVDVKLATASILVYPNPATSYVSVSSGETDYKNVQYHVYDLTGKKVLSEMAKAPQQDLQIGALAAGVYYLKITKNGAEINAVKIIKQ